MSKITWIGTGVMGAPMAAFLAKAGHELRLFNRTKSKAVKAAKEMDENAKVKVFDDIKSAVEDADFIFSIVGYPRDVEQIMLGTEGVLENAKSGAIVIDMTTSSPELAERLYQEGQKLGIEVLDAPVSGGDIGAKNGTLTIMVGGSRAAYDKTKDLFELMGKTINYMGVAGNGQHTKAANQIAVAGANAAYTEALVYGMKAGLDPETLLDAISGGSAGSWQMSNSAPKLIEGNYDAVFFVKYFVKDLRIAKAEIAKSGLELPMLNAVLKAYEDFADAGNADAGTQALIKLFLDEDELPSAGIKE